LANKKVRDPAAEGIAVFLAYIFSGSFKHRTQIKLAIFVWLRRRFGFAAPKVLYDLASCKHPLSLPAIHNFRWGSLITSEAAYVFSVGSSGDPTHCMVEAGVMWTLHLIVNITYFDFVHLKVYGFRVAA
jgi:hypothetical protein